MRQILRIARVVLLPLAGAVFITLWIIGAANTISAELPLEWIPYAALGLAIALARVSPITALVLVGLTVPAQVLLRGWRFTEQNTSAYLAVVIVVAVVAAFAGKRTRLAALVLSVAAGLAVGRIASPRWRATDDYSAVPSMILATVVFVVAWALGYAVQLLLQRNASLQRARTLERDMVAAELELAIAIERDRTAQDVHDIMAHSLSVIVAQADGALFLQNQRPEATSQSLTAIAQSARESLAELRVLLQSLSTSPEGHSHPSLAEVDALVARMKSSGLDVTDVTFGEPGALTAGQQLAVYRILQESLTNALTHGGVPTAVRITRDWRGPGLALSVVSTAPAALTPTVPAPGHHSRGITGMTERARLAGGWLAAEPDDEDPRRFIVTAFIPTVPVPAGTGPQL
ncbi:sensor histidine kinase [Conyzicola sp.]|uniref:sensor histidine kinase n=1 Tax=Conyzicola sp. TaxID=1969404 RepID=UPI003989A522